VTHQQSGSCLQEKVKSYLLVLTKLPGFFCEHPRHLCTRTALY